MKLAFRMFLLCSVLCLICSNSWAYADTYAPKIGHPTKAWITVLTCAEDQEKSAEKLRAIGITKIERFDYVIRPDMKS